MKKVQILLVACCLVCFSTFSQTPKIDSLVSELQVHPQRNRVEVLWGIAYELFDVDNAEALFYAARAYEEVWSHGDSLQIVKVGTTYGQLLRRLDQIDKSIEVSSRLLPIAKRHNYRKYWKMLLNSLLVANMVIDKYDKALDYCYQSLNLRTEDGDKKEISIAIGNIGATYYRMDDFDSAIEFLMQSVELDNEAGHLDGIATNQSNLGLCYIGKQDVSKAIEHFNVAKSALKNSIVPTIATQIDYGLALASELKNNFDSAKTYALRSLRSAEVDRDQRFQMLNLLLLAKLESLENNPSAWSGYLSRVELLPALKIYPHNQLDYYLQRANYNRSIGNFQLSTEYFVKYQKLNEATYNEDMNIRIRAIHVQRAQNENLALIVSQKEAMIKQKWVIGLCCIVIVLTACLLIVLFRVNSNEKRITRILDMRVRERTLELGKQRDELQHAYDEHFVAKSRIHAEVMSLVATFRGLIYLREKDKMAGGRDYYREAEVVAEKIVSVIGQFKSNNRRISQ